MKDSIRCCISCILPCGALDVIRVVHASGRVEEIGGARTVRADEIMRAYPKHVLRKPPSSSFEEGGGVGPRAVVLPPNAELQRGKIYFLVPVGRSTKADKERRNKKTKNKIESSSSPTRTRRSAPSPSDQEDRARLLVSDRYLSEILAERAGPTQRERSRGRVGVWRPQLESISEMTND